MKNQTRPDRPTAQIIIDGPNVELAVKNTLKGTWNTCYETFKSSGRALAFAQLWISNREADGHKVEVIFRD